MSDIVERLRDQGRDAFAKQYSLGMWKLCSEAADEIEQIRRDLSHAKAMTEVWMSRARKAEAMSPSHSETP